mmetsp:Transcript_9751/g.25175  ORF Transcript_9751/g.25175 Transcript_9751/m.25175 type:complete len:145 (+) Transcript_9751:305-739(+)
MGRCTKRTVGRMRTLERRLRACIAIRLTPPPQLSRVRSSLGRHDLAERCSRACCSSRVSIAGASLHAGVLVWLLCERKGKLLAIAVRVHQCPSSVYTRYRLIMPSPCGCQAWLPPSPSSVRPSSAATPRIWAAQRPTTAASPSR